MHIHIYIYIYILLCIVVYNRDSSLDNSEWRVTFGEDVFVDGEGDVVYTLIGFFSGLVWCCSEQITINPKTWMSWAFWGDSRTFHHHLGEFPTGGNWSLQFKYAMKGVVGSLMQWLDLLKCLNSSRLLEDPTGRTKPVFSKKQRLQKSTPKLICCLRKFGKFSINGCK